MGYGKKLPFWYDEFYLPHKADMDIGKKPLRVGVTVS